MDKSGRPGYPTVHVQVLEAVGSELGERVERLEGELGRLNMENADLKSQLKERDARIAKLESVLEESRRAGKRQALSDKPKRDPKKPGRKPGSKYGRQAVRAIPVPDKTFEAPCGAVPVRR